MFVSLLAALSLVPSPALGESVPKASYELKLENYDIQLRDYQFPSGMRILFQEDHNQPVVQITAVIDRGSEYDQKDTDGIAHVIEHLAFRAQHGDLPKNWDLIAQLGGSINASTSNDWTNYMTVAPVDAATSLLRIEALRLVDGVANVTEEDVRLETEIARNELRMRYENAAIGEAWSAIGAALYPPDHPYARSTIGTHDTLSNITLDKVHEYVENNYLPEYSTIVVTGDFKLDDSWPMLTQAFDGLEFLWMAREDAEAYKKLTTDEDRIKFLQAWTPKLQEYMVKSGQQPRKPRVDCDARREPPPPQTQEIQRVKGLVDSATVVTAWSLPGGYCDDEVNFYIAANLLTNYVNQTLDPEWDYTKQESNIEGLGCFASVDEYNSAIICYVEPSKSSGLKPEKLADRIGDALYMQWDKSVTTSELARAFLQWNIKYARASAMTDTLLGADLVSSLFSGRSFETAMFTHFTGNPAVFSYRMNQFAKIDLPPAQALAEKYITRDRMVTVIVEPLDANERARREAAANIARSEVDQPEYAGLSDAEKYNFVFDTESITPDAIARVTVTPDRKQIHEFTLDNGLRVAIMPYGEVPLVRTALQVEAGYHNSEPWGLERLSEALYSTGKSSQERLLAVAGRVYGMDNDTIIAEASSANLDAALNKLRWQVEDYEFNMASKRQTIDRWQKATKKDGKDAPDTWATRTLEARLWPGSPLGYWWTNERYDALREASSDQIKDFVYRKWQPANAELVIVGKVDPAKAEQSVRTYFGEWAAQRGVETGPLPPVTPPTSRPDRQVLVFDDPKATQSDILLSCQIDAVTDHDRAKAYVVGEVLSELAWRTLREKSGVTYGAGAYPQVYDGGAAALRVSSLVQNDATGFAVQSMFDIVAEGQKAEIPDSMIAAAKWSRARTFGIYQQSGDQMLGRLLGTDVGKFDYYDYFPKELGLVSKADFPKVLEPCVGHEVVTVVGPREYAEKQLTERGIPYEVVDWESLYQAQLTPKELKKYLKAKAKEEVDEAKKAAEESSG